MNQPEDTLMEFDPCPDDPVLSVFASGGVADPRVRGAIKAHVTFCVACRGKVARLRNSTVNVEESNKQFAQRLKERQEQYKSQQLQRPVSGTVWRATPESENELFGPLVLVLRGVDELGSGSVQVAEVSEQIDQATDSDIIMEKRESGLSFRCMVRSGNAFSTSLENLKTYVGKLAPELTPKVKDFCANPEAFDEDTALADYEFGSDRKGTAFIRRKGIVSGLPLKDDDPRLAKLDLSKRGCAYLMLDQVAGDSSADSKVPARGKASPLVRIALPLAALLAGAVVAAGVMYLQSQRSVEQLRASHGQEILALEKRFADLGKEANRKVAQLDQNKVELENRIAQLNQSLGSRDQESASLKQNVSKLQSQMAERNRDYEVLKKENEKVSALRKDTERRLGKAFDEEKLLREQIASLQQAQGGISRMASQARISHGEDTQGKELLQAAKAGDLAKVREILEQNQDLVILSDEHESFDALHWATYEGHKDVVAYLLKHGAKVNGKDKYGETPLMLASRLGYPDIVQLLLEHGADAAARNIENQTALDLAMANGHKEVAEILRSR